MAQRVGGTAKKSGVGRTSRLDYAARVSEAQTTRAIPLNLGPMLAVYKNRRRLAVRIEKMPHLARLSAGKNNGDNSWSLSFSEIDTLAYLPPEGSANDTVTLSVRLIDLDSGGSTIAVLDLSVSPSAADDADKADAPAREAQLRALREELEQAKSALKARDDDLVQLRQKAQRTESELTRQRIESEFGGGRGRKGDKGEVDESKYASLNAKLLLRAGDPDAQPDGAEEPADAAENSEDFLVRKGRAQPSKLMPAEQPTRVELAEESARALLAEARQRWAQEAAAELAKAEAAWKANEQTRLAAAETQWQAQAATALAQAEERRQRAEKALAETTARADGLTTRNRESELELERLTQQCNAWRKEIATRESAMAQASTAGQKAAREEVQRSNTEALARAQEVWRAEEAARVAAAEAQWRSQSSAAITALTTRCEKAEQSLAEVNARAQFATQRNAEGAAEIQSLRELCTGLRAQIAEREADLARAREEHERAREKVERETKDALARAEETWKADAVNRLVALEAAWQEKAAGAAAEGNARAERAEQALAEVNRRIEASSSRDRDTNNELQQLRQQCTNLKAQLDERAAAFAGAHNEFDEARKSWRRETDTALASAEASWKAGEAARLAAAERSWEAKAAAAMKDVQARCEAAEKTLAQGDSRSNSLRSDLARITEESRAQAATSRERATENEKLRAEAAELRAVIAKQEKALASAKSASADAKLGSPRDVEESLAAAQAAWKAEEATRFAAAEAQWRRQSESAIAELSLRCERAERNAQESRTQAEAVSARDQGNRFELRRLREELAVAEANLASREAELESLRGPHDGTVEGDIVLKPDRISGFDSFEREPPKPKGHLMRDVAIVACLGVAAVLGYPRLEAYFPQLGTLFGNVSVSAPAPAAAPQPETPVRPSAVVTRAANVRSGPSGTSPTSGTLQPGTKVEPVEKRGSWTFVHIDSPNAAMKEGWIFSEFLQGDKAPEPKAATVKAK